MITTERLRAATVAKAAGSGAGATALGEYGCFVGGQWIKTGEAIEVHSPYDASGVAIVHRAGAKQIEQAIAAAAAAFQVTRKMPSWKRADVLEKISAGIAARREDFARTIALEAGKPIKTARAEVDRAVFRNRARPREPRCPVRAWPGSPGPAGRRAGPPPRASSRRR